MNKVRANQIAAKALQTRRNYLYVAPNVPICPFNLAEAMGFDVRFVDIPSLEGMYLADDLTILIGSLRPEGRKNFTCAHEIGHHILGHGTAIDEILNALPDKTIEQEADFFAAMLLMPLSAVRKLSCEIVLDFDNPSETKIYFVSRCLGVSYLALVTQLYQVLNLISYPDYMKLKQATVSSIKERILGCKVSDEIFLVGSWWKEKAIDVTMGDLLLSASSLIVEGSTISTHGKLNGRYIFRAGKAGIAKISDGNALNLFVRVSREHFSGLNQYRYLEEEE